jgi:hypothetical protein
LPGFQYITAPPQGGVCDFMFKHEILFQHRNGKRCKDMKKILEGEAQGVSKVVIFVVEERNKGEKMNRK